MVKTIWNGVISFGLVNIPVGLYPATKDSSVSFNLLHKKDCGRIKTQRICSECGEVLEPEDLVKGYEYEKGHYIEVTKDELEGAKSQRNETIEIEGFVDIGEVDPIYFDDPYYLTPGKHGERAYVLLREALKESGKAGIARFVLRTKEYLAVVRAKGNALVLNTMHFADEVREAVGAPPQAEVEKEVLDVSLQLVDTMSTKFDIEKYSDKYKETLLEIIGKKIAGKPATEKPKAKEPPKVLDLMERLKASLSEASSGVSDVARTGTDKNGLNRKSVGRNQATSKANTASAGKKNSGTTTTRTKVTAAKPTTRKKAGEKPRLKLAA